MTRRDLLWRCLGGVLLAGGPTCELLAPGDSGGARGILTLLFFAATVLGMVLLVQGKKVALALRIDGSRHRMLPDLIRSRRRERRMNRQP
ncbi:hypothetical protein PMI02_05537 [Novosphingobium sp. AP12]|nr:hypothetical protein PMI02_05537 [Novosphingobium sp. AP12]